MIEWDKPYCDKIKVCNFQLFSLHICHEKGPQLHQVNYANLEFMLQAVVIESADRKTCAEHFINRGEKFMDDLICAESEDKKEFIDEVYNFVIA